MSTNRLIGDLVVESATFARHPSGSQPGAELLAVWDRRATDLIHLEVVVDGHLCDFHIVWIALRDQQVYPQLRMFDDAWLVLAAWPGLFMRMLPGLPDGCTPEQVIAELRMRGFHEKHLHGEAPLEDSQKVEGT